MLARAWCARWRSRASRTAPITPSGRLISRSVRRIEVGQKARRCVSIRGLPSLSLALNATTRLGGSTIFRAVTSDVRNPSKPNGGLRPRALPPRPSAPPSSPRSVGTERGELTSLTGGSQRPGSAAQNSSPKHSSRSSIGIPTADSGSLKSTPNASKHAACSSSRTRSSPSISASDSKS